MIFTSDDLPLALTTPVTSGECSSESSVCAVSPSPRIRYPLVNCIKALMLVVKTALFARVHNGDSLLKLAAASHSSMHFIRVVRTVPLPLLSNATPQYFAQVYQAALVYVPSPFDLVKPNITLDEFISRVFQLSNASNCVLVSACVYIDRLVANAPHLFVHSANVHKMFAVALMLAIKFHEDDYFSSQVFSGIFGIGVQELNSLELFFLQRIHFDTYIGTEQFRDAQIALMSAAINSSMGLAVLHTLRQYEVSDVAQASSLGRPWPVYDELDFDDGSDEMVDCAKVETKQTGTIISALARVQMEHDFVGVCDERCCEEVLRRFTVKGAARLVTLRRLWRMEVVEDLVLPAVELRWQTKEMEWGAGVDVVGGKGFGSFLANAAFVGTGRGDARAPLAEGAGMWHYVPPDGGGWVGSGVVVAGGLGVGASIRSTRSESGIRNDCQLLSLKGPDYR